VRTVRQALVDRTWIPDIAGAPSPLALWQYVQLWVRLREVQLSGEQDTLTWLWMTDGQYTSQALFQGGGGSPQHHGS
jgi:hypothetical protein